MLASRFQDNDKILSCQLAEFVAFISQGIADAFDLYSQAGGIVMSKGTPPPVMECIKKYSKKKEKEHSLGSDIS